MINPYKPLVGEETGRPQVRSPFVDGLYELKEAEAILTEDQPHLVKIFGKWLFICTLSAIPSFFLGALATENQYLGMATGILLFACGYVWLDRYTWRFEWRKNLVIRRILRIMYSTRVAISCSLIGTPLDMLCGTLALSITAFITRSYADANIINDFTGALLATMIQGAILNVVIVAYGLLLLAIYSLYKRTRKKP